MNIKDFPNVSASPNQDLPHRAMSREPAAHHGAMITLGLAAAVAVLGILWALYTLG